LAAIEVIMSIVAGTVGEWVARHEEVAAYLSASHQNPRQLAVARCERDSGFLGAVYHLNAQFFLHVLESLTKQPPAAFFAPD